MLSKALSELETIDTTHLPLLASLIGDGIAQEFMQYLKLADKVPKLEDIINNPEKVAVPSELGLQWATISMVTSSIDNSNYAKLEIYLRRFNMEMQVVALRYIVKHYPNLVTKTSEWRKVLASEIFI